MIAKPEWSENPTEVITGQGREGSMWPTSACGVIMCSGCDHSATWCENAKNLTKQKKKKKRNNE